MFYAERIEPFSLRDGTVLLTRSYIQNNHVYRIIPLKQRNKLKNEPIIKLAVLKSSLNF